jgi:hypothetical protein
MQANVPRKFTLIDAMVLIAATAVALVPISFVCNDPDTHLGLVDDGWPLWSIWLFAWELNMLMSALVITSSAAILFLRLRSPRPRFSRICRQPGAAACLIILVATFYFFAQYGLLVCFYHAGGYEWNEAVTLIRWESVRAALAGWVDISIPIVWLILWLGKFWRPEPSWIDRTGRVIGIYCTFASLLFGWAELVGKGW